MYTGYIVLCTLYSYSVSVRRMTQHVTGQQVLTVYSLPLTLPSSESHGAHQSSPSTLSVLLPARPIADLRQAPEPFLAVSLDGSPPPSSPSSSTFALSPSSPSPLHLGTSLLQKVTFLFFRFWDRRLGSHRFLPSCSEALHLVVLSTQAYVPRISSQTPSLPSHQSTTNHQSTQPPLLTSLLITNNRLFRPHCASHNSCLPFPIVSFVRTFSPIQCVVDRGPAGKKSLIIGPRLSHLGKTTTSPLRPPLNKKRRPR